MDYQEGGRPVHQNSKDGVQSSNRSSCQRFPNREDPNFVKASTHSKTYMLPDFERKIFQTKSTKSFSRRRLATSEDSIMQWWFCAGLLCPQILKIPTQVTISESIPIQIYNGSIKSFTNALVALNR